MHRCVLGCRDCARWGALKPTNFTSQHDHAAPRASTNPHRYQVDFISLIHLRPTFVGPNPLAPAPPRRPEDLRHGCAAVRHRRCPIAVPLPTPRPKGVRSRTEEVRRRTPLGAGGYVSGLREWGRLKTRPRILRSPPAAPEGAAGGKGPKATSESVGLCPGSSAHQRISDPSGEGPCFSRNVEGVKRRSVCFSHRSRLEGGTEEVPARVVAGGIVPRGPPQPAADVEWRAWIIGNRGVRTPQGSVRFCAEHRIKGRNPRVGWYTAKFFQFHHWRLLPRRFASALAEAPAKDCGRCPRFGDSVKTHSAASCLDRQNHRLANIVVCGGYRRI